MSLTLTKHPNYFDVNEMHKWRLAYAGGREFVYSYLEKFSSREDNEDFTLRKKITYVPRFAKADLNEVKDAIYQRMTEINRIGGDVTYARAIRGLDGGVDREGRDINGFMGSKALEELLLMGRVGIFIDMPSEVSGTLMNAVQRPYLYIYTREQIENWVEDRDCPGEFRQVCLVDEVCTEDDLGFPNGLSYRRRMLRKVPGGVQVDLIDDKYEKIGDTTTLALDKIPFVCGNISESLMADMADYQIALMNLASSDLMFLLKANHPFYVEKANGNVSRYVRQEIEGEDGETVSQNVKIGTAHGRQYSGDKAPEFIHPSSEPLKASMEKQEQMKQEMRQQLKLKIAQTTSTRVSKDSKEMDERTLENGLSAIGLELERMERLVADIWAQYTTSEPATIKYPTSYSLKSDAERIATAKDLTELKGAVPSILFAREMNKRIARELMSYSLTAETLSAIADEIDAAPGVTADSEQICRQVETAILDPGTGAVLLGYKREVAEKAAKAQADKAMAVAEAQAVASALKNDGENGAQNREAEKDPSQNKQGQGNRQRGPGK
jgi:hypothetical protein